MIQCIGFEWFIYGYWFILDFINFDVMKFVVVLE